jgi:RNA ligase
MNNLELKKFVEDNPKLVSMKPAGEGIYVLKYKKAVFYDNLWNEYLEECRGTIVDADFNIVTYPFTKIYNYGVEKNAPVFADTDMVTAYRKVNGFMVALTWYNNDVLVSTTGSTDSDFVGHAKEMMLKHMPWTDWQMAFGNEDMRGMTFMFECVHPNDPHIIPEDAGMYILGYRENEFGSKVGHDACVLQDLSIMFKCHKPVGLTACVSEVKTLAKECKHEGFVFYHADGRAAKIKSPYYLVKKFVARNPRTDKLMRPDIKQSIDEEYYPLIDAIQADITAYTALDEQARLTWVRNFLGVA